MRRFLLLSVAALALTACGPKAEKGVETATEAPAAATPVALNAAGLPKVRPGLWEVTRTADEGEGMVTEKQCVGEEGTRELRQMLTQTDSPNCTTTRGLQGGGFVVSSVCDQAGGVKTDFGVVWTGSETAFDMKIKLAVITPDGKRDGGEIVGKGRWIGACPAGVKPGDQVS